MFSARLTSAQNRNPTLESVMQSDPLSRRRSGSFPAPASPQGWPVRARSALRRLFFMPVVYVRRRARIAALMPRGV